MTFGVLNNGEDVIAFSDTNVTLVLKIKTSFVVKTLDLSVCVTPCISLF